jgi:tetratricopeptide (TPR) repeat protein
MGYLIGVVIVLIVGSGAFLGYKAYQKRKSRGPSRRQFDLAIVQLSGDIRRNPNNAVAYCKRGIIRQKKGDLTGALADFERAMALNPDFSEARYHHAVTLEQKGDLAGAEKEFNQIADSGENPYFGTAAEERLAKLRSKKKPG